MINNDSAYNPFTNYSLPTSNVSIATLANRQNIDNQNRSRNFYHNANFVLTLVSSSMLVVTMGLLILNPFKTTSNVELVSDYLAMEAKNIQTDVLGAKSDNIGHLIMLSSKSLKPSQYNTLTFQYSDPSYNGSIDLSYDQEKFIVKENQFVQISDGVIRVIKDDNVYKVDIKPIQSGELTFDFRTILGDSRSFNTVVLPE